MCSYFKQHESIPALTKFLATSKHVLRADAIKALGELKAIETEGLLKDMYINQPDICQSAIVVAIGEFRTGKSLQFLKDAFDSAINSEVKKIAATALYNYGMDGKLAFQEIMINSDIFSALILQHIANPLIKFK